MENALNHRMVTRSKLIEENDKPIAKDASKRSADQLPDVGNKKRILGDITNQPKIPNLKLNVNTRKGSKSSRQGSENSVALKNEKNSLSKDVFSEKDSPKTIEQSIEDSVYMTALEDSIVQISPSKNLKHRRKYALKPLPKGVEDFDKSCQKDPFSEARYAKDIFSYYLEREKKFPIKKYLDQQKDMTKGMRAILVDWMVEVQESFELNHETLYLAVKLVDRYLMEHFVPKSQLQLVGATAICIAAKFDERQPPLVDDFLYICDDSYTREQLIKTEIKILQTVDFDLGIPLSYRFLRRYARCSRMSMEILTLARYILETSLMDYDLIDVLDSKLAAGALLLALKMKKQEWNAAHEYYSEYKESDLKDVLYSLNKNISAPINNHLQTIRTKYSHPYQIAAEPRETENVWDSFCYLPPLAEYLCLDHGVFFEVSKTPSLKLSKSSN